MSATASKLLRALAVSPHGVVIVGDTESGKTTLLSILAHLLPGGTTLVSVERAGELRLPEGARRLVVHWPLGEQPGVSFGQQISAALAQNPASILLDEVRADEPEAIAPLLMKENAPRQIWTFRGPADNQRLRSALGMVARRSNPAQSEVMVRALYDRLPFIVTLKRTRGALRLRSIAEWQYPAGAEYPDYVLLMETGWDGLQLTGKRPAQPLDLPADFWSTSG
jgi:hypothetical protein